VFDSNYAKVSGGALFSASQVIPFSSTGLVLRNNSALIVGGDFAMPPFKFVWYNTNSSQAMSPSSVRYGSLNSGSVLPEIVVRVYDSQNSLTAQGATELLLITVLIADVNADPVTATSSVRAGILGELQKAAIQGGISFKNLRVVGVPGTYQLIVRSISDLYPASQFYLAAPLELSDCSMDMVNTTVDYSSFPVCGK
jgi:predicted outer membrane repeat protein